jgi:predicted helicase
MSRQHVNAYRTKLAKLHAATGSLNERVLSKAFGDLLEAWGRSHDLTFTPQWEGKGPRGNNIAVDGALVPSVLRIPFGYWEAKDSKDDLDKEIAAKLRSGYPDDNIIYEDTRTAVLRQNGKEAWRADMADDTALVMLLERFFAFERPELTEFRKAAKQFREDLPQILDALRHAIGEAEATTPEYAQAARDFLDHAKSAINPAVSAEDVREMLIQHILTEEIFTSVFDNAQYHRENNVAQRLSALEAKFFTGDLRYATMQQLRPYYAAIKGAAADIADRREKQTFVKKLYEDFYKVYNPKAADRLGVVYTPGEIVRFMIRGADWLCERHFGKCLIDPGVEILDPATGTGTFIVELLEHFQGDRDKLRHKYKEELHANEVAILPYYVANLNIEATYAAITGQYAEFPGLVFVDTLDNTAGLGVFGGLQGNMFGSLSDENMGRIKRQNERKISVVIGNPPYFANQRNENEGNKSREYPRIDARIRDTYIKRSVAKKTKRYDMYSRFFRWCSDRLQTNDGVLALVTNSNFIDAREADGFRKCVAEEFQDIWIINLKGNARTSGQRRQREGGNVFDDKIRVGVAVCFMVKRKGALGCTIHYSEVDDFDDASDKLAWLDGTTLIDVPTSAIKPDAAGVWISQSAGFPSAFLDVIDPKYNAKSPNEPCAIFGLYSNGVVTARDDWLTDFSLRQLNQKVQRFSDVYAVEQRRWAASPERAAETDKDKRLEILSEFVSREIKWTSELEAHLDKGSAAIADSGSFRFYQDRPFVKLFAVFAPVLTHRRYNQGSMYPRRGSKNVSIGFSGLSSSKPFQCLAVRRLPSYDLLEKTQFLPRFRLTKLGAWVDNITDWALTQFRTRYAAEFAGSAPLSKDDIFAYVYAALHDPVYRETYAADLRREFPRIPLHDGFAKWAAWGRALLDLHIGYEAVAPFGVTRVDVPPVARGKRSGKKEGLSAADAAGWVPDQVRDDGARGAGVPKPVLKSDPEKGVIVLDSVTQLTGIPHAAWEYRLGNRSAIDWVLDQHKEKKIKDPVVAAKFNTYRFADHKERVVDLLMRVVTVSVETVRIVGEIRAEREARARSAEPA